MMSVFQTSFSEYAFSPILSGKKPEFSRIAQSCTGYLDVFRVKTAWKVRYLQAVSCIGSEGSPCMQKVSFSSSYSSLLHNFLLNYPLFLEESPNPSVPSDLILFWISLLFTAFLYTDLLTSISVAWAWVFCTSYLGIFSLPEFSVHISH